MPTGDTGSESPRHPAAGASPGDSFAASRAIIDALSSTSTTPPTPADVPPPEPPPPSAEGQPVVGRSTDVVFPPRLGTRWVVGLLVLVALVATAGAAYVAYDDPGPLTLGAAGTLLVVTLVLYAVRAGSSPARLAIHNGQLEVRRGGQREVFDLTSRYARIEVVGTPGRRGWKVLFGRFGRDPFVVDASMVDPQRFTAALGQHRQRD